MAGRSIALIAAGVLAACAQPEVTEPAAPLPPPTGQGYYVTSQGLLAEKIPADEPPETELRELRIRIVCENPGTEVPLDGPEREGVRPPHRIVGREVRWDIDGTSIPTKEELLKLLRQVRSQSPTPFEGWRVVIDPGGQATYGDVAVTMDMVNAAGFADVSFNNGPRTRRED